MKETFVPRKKYFSALVCILALCLPAFAIEGRVVGIADGDTVTVLDNASVQHKIRLAGIDAPEKTQAFGNRSKQSLSGLAYNRYVLVQTTKRDKYGRIVGTLFVDGQDVNLTQIQRGMAWHYKAYEREQPQSEAVLYAAAEVLAKTQGEGLWADAEPEPPWEYRRRKRENR